MRHAWIAGGTGMLADATIAVAREHDTTTLFSRNPARFSANISPGSLSRCPVDFRDPAATERALTETLETTGPCTTALLWVHSVGEESLRLIFSRLRESSPQARVVWVMGSAAADPSLDLESRVAEMGASDLDLRVAILGFESSGGRSRWLTDKEISAGAIAAWRSDARVTTVGRTRPWSDRP